MADEAASYYDPEARIAYLRLGDGEAATAEEKDWGLIDHDAQGRVVGAEFRAPSSFLPPDLLEVIPKVQQ